MSESKKNTLTFPQRVEILGEITENAVYYRELTIHDAAKYLSKHAGYEVNSNNLARIAKDLDGFKFKRAAKGSLTPPKNGTIQDSPATVSQLLKRIQEDSKLVEKLVAEQAEA